MATIEQHDFSAFNGKQRKQLMKCFDEEYPTTTQTLTNKTLTSPTITDTPVSLLKDASGNYYEGCVTSLPAAGSSGYAVGCILNLSGCVLGQHPQYINMGTATSSIFVPLGICNGYAFDVVSEEAAVSAGGDATEVITDDRIRPGDMAHVQVVKSDDNDQICGAVCTDSTLTLTCTADPVINLKNYNWAIPRDNVSGTYDIFAAGTYDCLTADDATIAITVAGVESTDICFCNFTASDDNDLISDIILTTNTITVTASADPDVAGKHSLSYIVLRKRGTFQPSHYIAYAGTRACLTTDDDTVAVTVTGALATDVPIATFNATDDTDTFEKLTVAADSLTICVSADPDTDGTHSWNYLLARAY